MRDDPTSVQVIRVLVTLVGMIALAAGVHLVGNGPGHGLASAWGWILDAALGGGVLGLGIGMGVYGVIGEGEWLDRLRVRGKERKVLTQGGQDGAPPAGNGMMR